MTGDQQKQQTENTLFQDAVRRAAAWIGDYFAHPEEYPVLSQVMPGEVRKSLPPDPPEDGRSYERILDDFENIIVPGVTHWNHPSFFAYFSITGSYPGILGELLAAALNVNGMLWRTSPALTELESLSLDYLLKLLDLDDAFFGQILDTASTSSLVAIAAAREAQGDLKIRQKGMSGRRDVPALVLYASAEAHSSIDKAAIVLGLGTENVRRIRTDGQFRMDPRALREAVAADIEAGKRPLCVVATVGTTSTASVDPVSEIAAICAEHGLWLHVDAAYAWAAAILPEKRSIIDGCDRADSIVINPHKWLFTPIDLSVLFCRHRDVLKRAFSLVPEYLRSDDEMEQPNLMDYGFQLGRRFRALKLWMVINYFGASGLREKIRYHIKLAGVLQNWLEKHPYFEVMAPAELSLVCFRSNPDTGQTKGAAGTPGHSRYTEEDVDALNESLLENINQSGLAFLSHTKIGGRFCLRCAIGNLHTTEEHINSLQQLLEKEVHKLLENRT